MLIIALLGCLDNFEVCCGFDEVLQHQDRFRFKRRSVQAYGPALWRYLSKVDKLGRSNCLPKAISLEHADDFEIVKGGKLWVNPFGYINII